jgi:SAM-dependent methyltransferase
MSATGRTRKDGSKTPRDPLDRLYTPERLAQAHVDRLIAWGYVRPGDRVLDSGCGAGAYLRACIRAGLEVDVVDLDPNARGLRDGALMGGRSYAQDFLTLRGEWAAVLGNPPFGPAQAFIRHAITLAPVVAYLLPATFMGGGTKSGRRALYTDAAIPLAAVCPVLERPTFRLDGETDATVYNVQIWDRNHPAGTSWKGAHIMTPDGKGWGRPVL